MEKPPLCKCGCKKKTSWDRANGDFRIYASHQCYIQHRWKARDVNNLQCKVCNSLKVKSGKSYRCKKCGAARLKMKKYGISFQEAMNIPDRCRICKKDKPLGVDHNHKNKRFRDWLCRSCNLGFGFFQEDPMVLYAAYQYALHHAAEDICWSESEELTEDEIYGWK